MSLIKTLKKKRADINEQIREIQDACTHPEVAILVFRFEDKKSAKCGLCEKIWEVH
jgi:hypothetical protein